MAMCDWRLYLLYMEEQPIELMTEKEIVEFILDGEQLEREAVALAVAGAIQDRNERGFEYAVVELPAAKYLYGIQ